MGWGPEEGEQAETGQSRAEFRVRKKIGWSGAVVPECGAWSQWNLRTWMLKRKQQQKNHMCKKTRDFKAKYTICELKWFERKTPSNS